MSRSSSPTPAADATASPTPCGGALVPGLTLPKPNPEPALPAWFDAFNPPVTAGAASPCAPVIANSSKYVEVNHALAVTGENLSTVYDYVQTSAGNGQWVTLTAVSNSTENWIYNVPLGITANSAHMIWAASNANGPLSAPVLANVAQAWWVQNQGNSYGPVAAGDSIAAFGANLWYNNVTPEVVVTNSGVSSQVCALVAWRADKITFKVPAGLANGNYQVWLHNGHGGEYGWAGPLTLTVGTALAFNGGTFNAKTFGGAYGDGVHDDTYAITKTVAAAQNAPLGVAYFPAGTYLFSAKIGIMRNAEILGDGPDKTVFQGVTNYADTYFLGDSSGQADNDVVVSGCAFTAYSVNSAAWDAMGYASALHFNRLTDAAFINLSVSTGINRASGVSITAFNIVGDAYATIDHCNFYAYEGFTTIPSDCIVTNTNFYCKYDGVGCGVNGTVDLDFEGNQLFDYNPADPSHQGYSSGRLIDLSSSGRSSRNIDISSNSSVGTGVSPYKADQNAGEYILAESGNNYYGEPCTVTGATLNTVTVPGDAAGNFGTGFWYVNVIKGKGFGQWARVTADNGGVLTLDRPWQETPTSASFVIVSTSNENFYAAGNTKVSNGRQIGSGLEWYGTMNNSYVMNNSVTGMSSGVAMMALAYAPTQYLPCYFNYFVGNTLSGCSQGMYQEVQYSGSLPTKEGVYACDNFYFDNNLVAPTQYGFNLLLTDLDGGLASTTEAGMDGTVIMGTTGSLAAGAVGMNNSAGSVRQVNLLNVNNTW